MPFSEQTFQEYMSRYGYQPIEVPLIEPAALFLTKAGDQIIERLFTFEHHGKQLALRPEFTASAAARYIAEGYQDEVVRWQFCGTVFEDVPGSGSQNYQRRSMGAELIGMSGSPADAEIIAMVAQGLEAQGIDEYTLVIGHVGLTRRLLQNFQLDDATLRFLLNHRLELHTNGKSALLERLDAYLALHNGMHQRTLPLAAEETLSTLLSGRSMGGRSQEDIARRLVARQQRRASRDRLLEALDFLEAWGQISAPLDEALRAMTAFIREEDTQALFAEWKDLFELLNVYGLSAKHILVKPDLARSWDYYSGMVFEILSDTGHHLAGGGRYDGLTRLIGGEVAVPAVGFACYIDQIDDNLRSSGGQPHSQTMLLVENGALSVQWAQRLRAKGVRVALVPEGIPHSVLAIDAEKAVFEGRELSLNQLLEHS